MSLFQKSVTNKYFKTLDTKKVDKAFDNFQKFYGDKLRLANIMQLKEENYQEGFLREIFVETLGFTINPDKDYNLTTEYKNQKDARKADGAIIRDGKAIGVIELKSTKTKNLESIKEQAFGYKNNQPDCKYVITSNFQSLRFYVDNATEYEEFNLFHLDKKQFKLLYLLLSKESIFSDLPEKLKKETKFHENEISTQLYSDYKHFKDKIFENLVKNNPQYDKLTLFKKSQKLLDRFLFVFFAEDSGLIPPNAVSKIVEQWKTLQELDEYKPLYSRFQKLFTHLNKGHSYKKWGEIPAYNGGLFRNDEVLDNSDVKIDDEILEKDSLKLSKYDFNTEVDVNILGHIFEHSLNEIEEMEKNLIGLKDLSSLKISKRKKDGVFYTPKYITKYIVENTVGTLCNEKKDELQINNLLIDENYHKKDGKINEKGKKLFKTLNNYKNWLITLKILDPACGSGAFLNQTLDFLIAEHKLIADLQMELTGDASSLFVDIDKAILENNIYGVDINEESVEIAKLSLWLRTAQKGRKLSDLSGNIKCGNSLIDDPVVAGDKAFDWHKEFPHVFNPKIKEKAYQKIPESKPDYLKLIKEKSKEAQEKAEKSAELSKEAVEISKQVYEYAEKLDLVNEPEVTYGINNGGFDVVIGNPPYVLCQPSNTENEVLEFYKTFAVASYKIDLFHLFFEKAVTILKQNGKLGFITPNTYLTNKYIKPLRNFLLTNTTIRKIINHKEPVFAEASVDVATIIIRKSLDLKKDIEIFETESESFFRFITKKKHKSWFDDKDNVFNLREEFAVNFTNCKPLIEICSSYFGIQAFDRKSSISLTKNNADFLPIIDGADIFGYQYSIPTKYFNFINTNIKSGGDYNIYKEDRIVIRQIGRSPIVGFCKANILCSNTIYSINLTNINFDLKYILTILNSKLIKAYWLSMYSDGKQLFPKIKGYQLKELPIKEISQKTQQPFIEKADLMLSLNKELQKEKDNFLNTIKEEKGIEKITKKLDAFYDFEYDILKKELAKQKVKFALGNENNEWREYFNTAKKKINDLQNKINQTDNEIDKMVYELYELTDEEIGIVENSIK